MLIWPTLFSLHETLIFRLPLILFIINNNSCNNNFKNDNINSNNITNNYNNNNIKMINFWKTKKKKKKKKKTELNIDIDGVVKFSDGEFSDIAEMEPPRNLSPRYPIKLKILIFVLRI